MEALNILKESIIVIFALVKIIKEAQTIVFNKPKKRKTRK